MDNYYQIYINDVLTLVQTLVIKSEDTADAQNDYVAILAAAGTVPAVETTDPTTWRYYMNLAGEYHVADTMMQVVSLDTLETIDFTQANLAIHLATAEGYQFGTRQYLELVALYPQQEPLIKGILHPVDINLAIAAPDWAILWHDPVLVEVNEYSFISKLQTFINGTLQSWINKKYNLKHIYYPILYHGMMYLFLIPEVLNIRLAACGTNEAHSYHVKMYLASHMGLDVYQPDMTTAQALWLYRNITYIERNTGQQATFDSLLANLMTARAIPLTSFTMRHDISAQPASLDPVIAFDRTLLNPGTPTADILPTDLTGLLNIEQPLARNNATVQPDVTPTISAQMLYSRSNELATKTLQSSMVDYTNSNPYNLPDILLNHWLYLSGAGLYESYIFPINPQDSTSLPLNAKDAFVVMLYSLAQTYGIDLTASVIPALPALRVQAVPKASVSTMLRVISQPYRTQITPLVTTMLAMNPSITTCTSVEAFVALCQQITTAAQQQRNLVAQRENMYHHAMLFCAVDQIYADVRVSIAPVGETFSAWFKSRNLDFTALTPDNFATLAVAIYQQATGQDGTVVTLKDLQAAMAAMFTTLSSYSIQIVPSINAGTLHKLDTPQLRLGHVTVSSADHGHVNDENVVILASTHSSADRDFVRVANVTTGGLSLTTNYDLTKRLWVGILPGGAQVVATHRAPLKIWAKMTGQDAEGNPIPIGGFAIWATLSAADQASLAEVLSNELYYPQPPSS